MDTEQAYLEHYDIRRYPAILVTVDSVLFTVKDEALCVLIVKRANNPQKNFWGLPGGFIDPDHDDTLRTTALRKLKEKTGIAPPYLEQLACISGKNRDPRGWSLTSVYFALMAHHYCAPDIKDVQEVIWVPVTELFNYTLAFDHYDIINTALDRLRQKTSYSMIPVYCLKEEFTLSELQQVIEIILEQPIQRKSLIRRFEASNMFEDTGKMATTGARKAKLYRHKKEAALVNFSRNLLVQSESI